MNNKATPQYIIDFFQAICPSAPELAMASFNEKLTLETATEVINDLRNQRNELVEVLKWSRQGLMQYMAQCNLKKCETTPLIRAIDVALDNATILNRGQLSIGGGMWRRLRNL